MTPLLEEIRHNPLLWLLAFVPAVFACHQLTPESHTLSFVLSVFAIVPLAALLSHATESLTAARVTNSGRSTWFVGVPVLMVYSIFAMTLYLLPPRAP